MAFCLAFSRKSIKPDATGAPWERSMSEAGTGLYIFAGQIPAIIFTSTQKYGLPFLLNTGYLSFSFFW